MPALVPDLTWVDGEFRRDIAVEYSATTGRITRVGPARSPKTPVPGEDRVLRLTGRALMPGFINAHSESLQRLTRGRGQWRSNGEPPLEIATWRAAMDLAVSALSPDDVFEVSRFCFIEMLSAGITTVGEFHYLHRDHDGSPYANVAELSHRVMAAAEDAGIRICLLNVACARSVLGEPLRPEQRRFETPDLEAYLTDTMELVDQAGRRPLVTVGVAPYSLAAVPRGWLGAMHSLAFGLGAPLHMRVSGQPTDVTASLEAYGRRPVEVLAEEGVIDEHFTAVHATHLTFREVDLLGIPGPTVCACPTTERDLGTGFLPGRELIDAGARIALGSGSNSVIDPFEEMRLLEYHERLRRQRRAVLATLEPDRARLTVAPPLLGMATEHGARSLRVAAGRIEPDRLADFIAIDLEHRALEGWTEDTLAAMLVLTSPAAVVSDVWVGGVERIRGGRHRLDRESTAAFRGVMRRIDG